MERAPISVAPSGRAATKAFAALLVLELAVGTFGCSKSKPQNSQNSSNQTVASVAPAVFRICIWIWSYVMVSVQCGWYQKLNVELADGTVTACVRMLSPLTAAVDPTRAE